MVDNDFDLPEAEWFDGEVTRWNTERKRQYLFELPVVAVLSKAFSAQFSDDFKSHPFRPSDLQLLLESEHYWYELSSNYLMAIEHSYKYYSGFEKIKFISENSNCWFQPNF